jgi:hypothetical protein
MISDVLVSQLKKAGWSDFAPVSFWACSSI